MEQENIYREESQEQDGLGDFKKIFFKILRYWYFIVISVAFTLGIAYLINKYTSPVYVINTSILIKAPKDNSVSGLLYGGEMFKSSSNLENEAILLKRFKLVEKTLNDLDFSISYLKEGNVRTTDIYPDKPVEVFINPSSKKIPYYIEFKCLLEDTTYFKLKSENEYWNAVVADKVFKFNEEYILEGFNFRIVLNDRFFRENKNHEIIFKINDMERLADSYVARLNIGPLKREASILQVSLTGTNPQKEVEFLNKLSENYISSGLEEKNLNASKTIEFIETQLNDIRDSLNLIEGRIQNFKSLNSSVDLSVEGARLYTDIQGFEKEKAGLMIKKQYMDYLSNYLNTEDSLGQVIIPSSLGIQDNVLNSLIGKLVELQLENKMVKTNEVGVNPVLRQNKQRVEEIVRNIKENLKNIKEANLIALNDIEKRTNQLNVEIQRLPGAEREFINIRRVYSLSETLYLFLMEKRAEASISKAANTADYRVVNAARLKNVGGPILPKINQNYVFGGAIGFAIPIIIIFLIDFFNNKVRTQEELSSLTTIPFIGLIGHSKNHDDLMINQNPKSILSESFRTVRTNLRYLSEAIPTSKTFLITSSISGEGKTFCAKNLAYIFSLSGKKTLLINSDMRKKNSYKEFGVNNHQGLSNYLAGLCSLEEIINKSNSDNLFIITSGDIPPNPSELLLSEKTHNLIVKLKEEYDYIFLDTPPIGILSDGMELMKYSDVNIFLVREDYTIKNYVASFNHMYKTGKIKNVAMLYNDADLSKLNYGYGYGYGYGAYGGYGEESGKNGIIKRLLTKKSSVTK